jgi:hypothetical protein
MVKFTDEQLVEYAVEKLEVGLTRAGRDAADVERLCGMLRAAMEEKLGAPAGLRPVPYVAGDWRIGGHDED